MNKFETIRAEFRESSARFDKALRAHKEKCQELLMQIEALPTSREGIALYRAIEGEVDNLININEQL